MIFPYLETESLIQVNDKIRFDVSRSFAQGETIDQIEVEPEASAGFFIVSEYLDWAYQTDGTKQITVRITGSISGPVDMTYSIDCISSADDNLFSSDSDLMAYEDDILKYIRNGRNSFLDKHRKAQEIILNELDANRIWKDDGTRYTALDIIDVQEFKQWSVFLTLKLICESLSKEVDDLWDSKASKYDTMMIQAKKRATLRLDSNGDTVIDEVDEKQDIYSTFMVRR